MTTRSRLRFLREAKRHPVAFADAHVLVLVLVAQGEDVGPARGISLAPHFTLQPRPEHEELFYYFNPAKTALLQGEWKLVDAKELYRINEDRIESNDLSAKHPERFEAMKARWAELAKSYGATGKAKGNNRKKKKAQ